MKLSQLFSGEVRTDGPVHTSQPSPAQMEQLNRQIRSLVPGQTITGEIVSRNGGYAGKVSDACILIPVVDEQRITPHAEGWQGVIWHLLVNAIV